MATYSRDAGLKADAHRVQRLIRENYLSWDKDVSRRKVVRSLSAAKPTLVLDLNGGGASAETMTTAGLDVLSVEDGRSFDAIGVTKSRGRRAFEVWATEGGYRAAWGRAADFAIQGDAAFWDFMGHWSPEVRRTLIASRHMKAIAVTLMPERTPLGHQMSLEEWSIAYRALLEATTGMTVSWTHAYKRASGRNALVFFLRPDRGSTTLQPCQVCGGPRPVGALKFCSPCRLARDRTYQREKSRIRRSNPEYRERAVARTKTWKQVHRRHVLESGRERENARYATDPEVRNKKIKAATEWNRRNRNKGLSSVSGTPDKAISIEEAA